MYHIAYRIDWEKAKKTGVYHVESLDTEGFIHMSTEEQVIGVANSFFKDQKDLALLTIDYHKIENNVKWEGKQTYGEDYPHHYGVLPIDTVIQVKDFTPNKDGLFTL